VYAPGVPRHLQPHPPSGVDRQTLLFGAPSEPVERVQLPPRAIAPCAAMAALPETLGASLVQSRLVVNLSQQLLSEEPTLAAQGATNLTRLLLSEGGIEVLFREPAGIVVRPAAHPLAHALLRARALCDPAVLSNPLHPLGMRPRAFVSPPLESCVDLPSSPGSPCPLSAYGQRHAIEHWVDRGRWLGPLSSAPHPSRALLT
jgi:hypothetical protein